LLLPICHRTRSTRCNLFQFGLARRCFQWYSGLWDHRVGRPIRHRRMEVSLSPPFSIWTGCDDLLTDLNVGNHVQMALPDRRSHDLWLWYPRTSLDCRLSQGQARLAIPGRTALPHASSKVQHERSDDRSRREQRTGASQRGCQEVAHLPSDDHLLFALAL
jgi:hypothetical protein